MTATIVVFEETQIATAEKVHAVLSEAPSNVEMVSITFDEPIIEYREYATIERFTLQFSKNATVEEIKSALAQGIRDNRMRWNRASFRKAIAFGNAE